MGWSKVTHGTKAEDPHPHTGYGTQNQPRSQTWGQPVLWGAGRAPRPRIGPAPGWATGSSSRSPGTAPTSDTGTEELQPEPTLLPTGPVHIQPSGAQGSPLQLDSVSSHVRLWLSKPSASGFGV